MSLPSTLSNYIELRYLVEKRINVWLQEIGFTVDEASNYATLFGTGGYDTLQDLQQDFPTNELLKDIGITITRHRVQILNSLTTQPTQGKVVLITFSGSHVVRSSGQFTRVMSPVLRILVERIFVFCFHTVSQLKVRWF